MRFTLQVTLILFMVIIGYNNCGAPEAVHAPSKACVGEDCAAPPPGDLNEQDYLQTAKPALLCGEEGFKYLHKEHFLEHCGNCHQDGGLSEPTFADPDVGMSFFGIQLITEADLLHTSVENRFCGNTCNLSKDGEVYKAIVEWLANRDECP